MALDKYPTGKDLDLLVLWAVGRNELDIHEGCYPSTIANFIEIRLGGDGMFIPGHFERALWRSVERLRERGLITADDGTGYRLTPEKEEDR